MGYFELKDKAGVDVTPYPFDFHSHFNGILPLENKVKWDENNFTIDDITVKKGDDLSISDSIVEDIAIKRGDDLSILGLLGGKSGEENKKSVKEAHYKLFKMVLKHIEKKNPFTIFDMNDYQRGECAAENIYIACCILQYISGNRVNYDPRDPDIYQITHRLLENTSLESEAAYHVIAYFNKKLFAANKYTPFDDAYWVRGAITDHKDSKGNLDYLNRFNLMSLCYMYASGVRYAQIALGKSSVDDISKLIESFQNELKKEKDVGYKLLAQSPAVYSDKKKFENELKGIVKLFELDKGKPNHKNLVGIDLLASENKTGLYKEFFDFLLKNKNIFNEYIEKTKASKKAIMHIHCGEGGGNSENNRSLCGYYLCNAAHPDMQKFSSTLAEYAIKCYRKNVARKDARERERKNLGKGTREYSEVTTLFDELFNWNNLVIDGLQLHRFDINSPVSRALVAYNGKINIIHLCDTLEEIPKKSSRSYYDSLCGEKNTEFSFRIGHAYYNRNYLNARFPELYYDTNLGSNFITGASGVFDSTQLYKLNSGLRKLNGHIDTNLIEEVLNSVSYPEEYLLNAEQVEAMAENSLSPPVIINAPEKINEFVKTMFVHIKNMTLTVEEKQKCRYSILSIAFSWRSFLLGADGQGVEHSDIQIESMRMALMLAYKVSDRTKEEIGNWFKDFTSLIVDVSKDYWEKTIGSIETPLPSDSIYRIEHFQGFKARNSVVLVKTSRLPPEAPQL